MPSKKNRNKNRPTVLDYLPLGSLLKGLAFGAGRWLFDWLSGK